MATTLRSPKRGDLMVEEIKRWIAERRLAPGDKLPKEDELQELFGVSKGTAREALKSLEVQGLVTVTTGPAGGATIGEVPLERALQLLQNYLFFRELDVAQIYAVRRLLEPELAAGAVPHLTEEHFAALERSIETCAPHPANAEQALAQRQEDLHFHDVLAAANPNMLLRFMCQVINHLLRHSVAMGDQNTAAGHKLGETNVAAHRRLLAAARRGDAEQVRKLMVEHIDEAERHVHQVAGAVRRRFVLEFRAARAHRASEVFQEGEGEMTGRTFGRRQAVIGTGAAVMTAAAARAAAADGDWRRAWPRWNATAVCSACMRCWCRAAASSCSSTTASARTRAWGRKLGTGHVRPDRAARPALGHQEHRRHALWHCAGRRQGAAARGQALRPVPRVRRPRRASPAGSASPSPTCSA